MSEPMNDISMWPEHRNKKESGNASYTETPSLVSLLHLQAKLIDRMLAIILEDRRHVRH